MSKASRRTLYWTPRVLAFAYVAFLAVFSLDVFQAGIGFWQLLPALAMHLVPAAIVAAVLAVAWRREWIGTVLFAGVGLYYTIETMRRVGLSDAVKVNWILTIAGPAYVIATLFLISWSNRTKLHPRT